VTELPSWLATAGAIAAAVGAVGGLAGLAALIRARAEKRKLDAEADKTDADTAEKLTQIALTLVEPMQREVSRQAGIISEQDRRTLELVGRVGQLESDQHTQRMLLVEHSVWDHLALARMADAGIILPEIPPLFPPRPQPAPAAASVTVEVTATEAQPAT